MLATEAYRRLISNCNGRGGAYGSRRAVRYALPDQHHAVQYAPPDHSAALRSMRLPRVGAAAKLLTMLRWVLPDQIVIPKLLRESRNKNLDIFATFLRLRIVASFPIAD